MRNRFTVAVLALVTAAALALALDYAFVGHSYGAHYGTRIVNTTCSGLRLTNAVWSVTVYGDDKPNDRRLAARGMHDCISHARVVASTTALLSLITGVYLWRLRR
jgi:hypothetical protein